MRTTGTGSWWNPIWLTLRYLGGWRSRLRRSRLGYVPCSLPLRVGMVRLGALDLYRDGPGALTDEQHGDAMVMASVIAQWVLDVQAHAPEGSVAEELEHDADFHFVVHNAAGV